MFWTRIAGIPSIDKIPLKTNFYSYTEPDFKTINHHWGSGVLFNFIHITAGFKGLTIINSLLLMAALLLIVFTLAKNFASKKTKNKNQLYMAIFLGVLAVPLMATRTEIRPESFSYLLFSLYLFLLQKLDQKFSKKLGVGLLLFQLTWVNLHIFFIFGNFLIALYAFKALAETKQPAAKKTLRNWGILFVGSLVANLINPSGILGALEPLAIFKEFGYLLAENQTIFFMFKRNAKVEYILYLALGFFTAQTLMLAYVNDKNTKTLRTTWHYVVLAIVFYSMGLKAIRLIPLGTLATIVLLYQLLKDTKYHTYALWGVYTICLGGLLIRGTVFSAFKPNTGFGLLSDNTASAEFFKSANLKGPIFNNYDIGGLLIYKLYPNERVFVDNRPEAYSVSFFQNVYTPAQNDEAKWKELEDKYKFNTIFFYRHDFTPWGQKFLISRFRDKTWTPVFVDEFAIIYVKDNADNKDVVKQYALPEELFSITKTNTMH